MPSDVRRRTRPWARRRTRRSRADRPPATSPAPSRARRAPRRSRCCGAWRRWPGANRCSAVPPRRDTRSCDSPDSAPRISRRAFEDRQGVPGHGGQRPDAVVAAHDAAGLAGPARPDGGPVQHQHVAHAQLDQGAGGAQPGDPGPDDDDVGRLGHGHRGVAGGQPGIQLVPARGTLAIAAASTVRAARSSGSR